MDNSKQSREAFIAVIRAAVSALLIILNSPGPSLQSLKGTASQRRSLKALESACPLARMIWSAAAIIV
jgi:hypothetical protein